jgi:hypothetical protein
VIWLPSPGVGVGADWGREEGGMAGNPVGSGE